MTTTNTVTRFRGGGEIELEARSLGSVLAGEVRLRVDVCALCGSDKRLLKNGSSVVPGHEIGGAVVDRGSGCDLPEGTRGIVYIPEFCAQCRSCRRGETNRCMSISALVGWQRDGGFATYVDIPQRQLIPVPDDLSIEVAVLGLDTVGTAAHGLRMGLQTQAQLPERTLVIGCGPLGLGVLTVAQELGIKNVDVTDPHPERAAAGKRLGGNPVSEPAADDPYDLVIEGSGARSARQLAQEVVVPGGAVVVLGESEEPYEMPATPRWRRTDCFTVRSFYFPMTEVEENWRVLRSRGEALLRELSTPMLMPELPAAFESFVAGDLLKPFITSEENR